MTPVETGVLDPGRSIEVTVTLHIGIGAGHAFHVAEVETDGLDSGVEIRTSATIHARATLEEVRPDRVPLDPGQSRRVEFVVLTFGVASDPPPTLGDRSIRSGLATEWAGVASRRVDGETGIEESSRVLAVTLPKSSEPGPRSMPLEVIDDRGEVVGRRWIGWEVAEALKAVPGALVISPRDRGDGLKVVIRGRDGSPFRVVSTSTGVEGLELAVDDRDARLTHVLVARLDRSKGPPGPRTGEIEIRTDHPGQPLVKVAVYIPRQDPEPAAQEAPEKSR